MSSGAAPRRRLLLLSLAILLASATLLAPAPDAAVLARVETASEPYPEDLPPVTPDNPRVWPAADLPSAGLQIGAVDAWQAPARASEAGLRWTRVIFSWRERQPSGPDDWSGPWIEGGIDEKLIDDERRAGRRVVGLIARTPTWAAEGGHAGAPPLGLHLAHDDPGNHWSRYVAALAARYAGRVDDWIVWNEPDVWSDETHSRQWLGTPEDYYQLLKTGYLAVKGANPGARVWMAGLTYWWDYPYGREQYFSRILRLAAADPTAADHGWYFDGAVVQLYNDPRGLFEIPRVFKRIMAERGVAPSKPVWINETNVVPWDDPVAPLSRDHYRATLDEQASYVVQALAYAMAAGTDHVAFYKWVDDPVIQPHVEQAFGMLRHDAARSTRPAFEALRAAKEWLAPTRRAQLVDEGPVVKVILEQPARGRRVTVAWNRGDAPAEARVTLHGSGALLLNRFGRQVGAVYPEADGRAAVALPPATANTIPGYPSSYFIGGEPILVAEALPESYQPLPPAALLPRPALQREP